VLGLSLIIQGPTQNIFFCGCPGAAGIYGGQPMLQVNEQKNGESPPDAPLFEEFDATAYNEWRKEAERLLKGASFEKRLLTATHEGITLEPIFCREDIADITHADSLPGSPPFVRGASVNWDKAASWEIAQEVPHPGASEAGSAIEEDMQGGASAVNLCLDRASGMAADADCAKAEDVGATGASIACMQDLSRALNNLDLEKVPVYLHAGSSGLPLFGLYMAAAKKQGIDPGKLCGAVAADPLAELISEGMIPHPLDAAMDETAEMTAWALDNAPSVGTIWVRGDVFHDRGASAVQELGFLAASALFHLRAMEQRGIAPERASQQMRFSFSLGGNFFMEVAKLRAARIVWNRVLEACGVPVEKRSIWIHCRTSRRTQTEYDPYVNMLRTTTQAFSGIVGGADSLHAGQFDDSIARSTRADGFSRRIARNTQLILRDEANLDATADPAGGSWYVESLTDQVARSSWEAFREIDRLGGMNIAIEQGNIKADLEKTANARDVAAALRKDVIVGTNRYPNPSERTPEREDTGSRHAAFIEKRAAELREHKASAEHENALVPLKKIENCCKAGAGELAEAVILAAANGATIGEIARHLPTRKREALRMTRIPLRRPAEPFERLRKAVEKHRGKGGPALVFLATLGPAGMYMPRLDFSASFFEAGGFDVIRTKGHESPEEAAKAAIEQNAQVVVICGLDNDYPGSVPIVAKETKKADPGTLVVLAGLPADKEQQRMFEESGVDLFIHVRVNMLDTLKKAAERTGISI